MIDLVVIGIIVVILGSAIGYIVHEKKNGAHCIGCPDSKTCGSNPKNQGNQETGCSGTCGGCSGNCHH